MMLKIYFLANEVCTLIKVSVFVRFSLSFRFLSQACKLYDSSLIASVNYILSTIFAVVAGKLLDFFLTAGSFEPVDAV